MPQQHFDILEYKVAGKFHLCLEGNYEGSEICRVLHTVANTAAECTKQHPLKI